MRDHLYFAVLIVYMFFGPKSLFADVIFVVHPTSQIESVDEKMIKDIFLGNIVKWPDNSDISFVLTDDNAVHESFLKKVMKRNPNQYMRYWRQMVFSGKGNIPKALSEKDVLDFVSSHEGAIGYVEDNSDLSTVKILHIAK